MSEMSGAQPLIALSFVRKNRIRFFPCPEFGEKYIRQPLTLSYPPEIDLEKLPQSVVNIPFIMSVIATVWFSGKKYTVEEMDEDLYHSLGKVKTFYQRFFYNTAWEGDLIPERLVKNRIPKTNFLSASLYTGGLDSTATVLRHRDKNPILISFNAPHVLAEDFAASQQLEICQIDTNYNDFLKLKHLNKASIDITKWFWDTSMGLSWVGMVAPFLYAKGIPAFAIPSGFTWRSFLFPDGQTMRQPASPVIDDNLSPMGLRVEHDAFSMTRTDKIKFISTFCSQNNISKPQLVVCTHHSRSSTTYTHCNKCFKCCITMLDILAIGNRLQDYGFTLSEAGFIAGFQKYVETLKMRRGGTYSSFLDTQRYLKKNRDLLRKDLWPFYDWFLAIDFWARVEPSTDRPLRATPFRWRDYEDLYPGVKDYTDE